MLKRAAVYLILSMTAGLCSAQDVVETSKKPDPRFVRLDLVVKEVVDERTVNSRAFSTIAAAASKEFPSVRTGSRVPIRNSSGDVSYIDVGVSIDYRNIKDLGDALSLDVVADISSLAGESVPTTPSVIRQNKWSSTVLVPLRKPTLLFSSDDVTSKGKLQVELTATPIKP